MHNTNQALSRTFSEIHKAHQIQGVKEGDEPLTSAA